MLFKLSTQLLKNSLVSNMKNERKQKIIAKATQMISKQGYDSFNMKELAELSGVPRASIYRAYASKEHLLSEITLDWGLSLVSRLQNQPHKGRTNGAKIKGVFKSILEEAQNNPKLIQAVLDNLLSSDKSARNMEIKIEGLLPALLSSAIDYKSIPNSSKVLSILLRLLLAELQMLTSGRSDLKLSIYHLSFTAEKLIGPDFWNT